MDWHLDACDGRAVVELERDFGASLRRHGAPDSNGGDRRVQAVLTFLKSR